MLANRMELRDWTIGIAVRLSEDDANAEVFREANHKYASIRLREDWDDRTDEKNRLTLVHELIHCHFTESDQLFNNARKLKLGKKWLPLLGESLEVAEERAVSSLANIIAPFMPLPGDYDDEDPGNAGPHDHPIADPISTENKWIASDYERGGYVPEEP